MMKKGIGLLLGLALMASAFVCHAEESKKALIIYFDYSENIDTEGLDADEISSASVAEGPGTRDRSNLLVMVDMLEERTGAEVYPLHIEEVYEPMFGDMVDKAQTDKDEDVQFTFKEELPDLTEVDRIYFGSAIWWYGMPQPVVNFFEQADLSGKELMYFSINRGSGNSGILDTLKELQPDVNVFAEVSIRAMQDNESAQEEFGTFLDSLDSLDSQD